MPDRFTTLEHQSYSASPTLRWTETAPVYGARDYYRTKENALGENHSSVNYLEGANDVLIEM